MPAENCSSLPFATQTAKSYVWWFQRRWPEVHETRALNALSGFFQLLEDQEVVGRGGGDRNDRQTNKACALYALQPPPLANWNKRNKRQALPSQVCRAADEESQQQLSNR